MALLRGLARGAPRRSWSGGSTRLTPLDPGVERTARALGRGRPGTTPVRAQRLQALPPRSGRQPRRARGRGRCLEAELEAAAPAASRLRMRSWRASWNGRAGSCGSATGTPSRRLPTSGRGASLSQSATAAGQIALARFRDLAGCGRRDAQLLLERLDADGVTRRVGDARRASPLGGQRLPRPGRPSPPALAPARLPLVFGDGAHRTGEHHRRPALAEAGQERERRRRTGASARFARERGSMMASRKRK